MYKNFPLVSFLCLSLYFFSSPKSSGQSIPLTEGDQVADFSAKATLAGKAIDFSLKNAIKDGPVVVYFFPSAYTQGCDLQAHTFSEHSDEFETAGATILGISADDIDRLYKFSADPDFCAGDFAVASDPDGNIAKDFGLKMSPPMEGATDVNGDKITHGFIPRVTFVIDSNHKIAGVFSSETDGLSPDEHVKEALSVVKGLK